MASCATSRLRAEAVTAIADLAAQRGWGAVAVTVSPLPGPSGNVEFFLLLRRGPAGIAADDIAAEVRSRRLDGGGG